MTCEENSKKLKICLIGNFGGLEKNADGQTVKTRSIYDFLKTRQYDINFIDTYCLRKRPTILFRKFKKKILKNDIVILCVANGGYKILAPYLFLLKRKYGIKIFDFVVGGSRCEVIKKYPWLRTVAKNFDMIYVETAKMSKKYHRLGIKNVRVLYNFKNVKMMPCKDAFMNSDSLSLCTFSRVDKNKGITDAIEAIRIINQRKEEKKYYLDIYGKIADDYRDAFYDLVEKNKAYVRYMGVADFSNSTKIISKYDVLIFPTYYPGEGFAGTLLDALFASVPIIATDFKYNFEILDENKNAIKVNKESPAEIANAMHVIALDEAKLIAMSRECRKRASDFTPEKTMQPFLQDLRDLADANKGSL